MEGNLNFCTLFDSNYLTRGLAMYESLIRHNSRAVLYVFAFDDNAENILKKLNLPRLRVISLQEFEDPELLRIKPTRNKVEYCWTSTPSTILYCLEKFNLAQCTYVDADIYFFHDPQILLDEMGPSSVLITEHRYTPEYDQTQISGRFCVQFVSFKADSPGLKVLRWWRDRCLDWCYQRVEDGKFGDQKYLDSWPTHFEKIHILNHLGGGLAPWNIQQYLVKNPDHIIHLESGQSLECIFYHFHQLRLWKNGRCDLGGYVMPQDAVDALYKPYLTHLLTWDALLLRDLGWEWASMSPEPPKKLIGTLERVLLGNYNVYPLKKMLLA